MHELSIAQSVLEIAEQEAQRQGFHRIRSIRCRIGVLQQVVPELLDSAFGCLIEATEHVDAELIVEKAPVIIHCDSCGEHVASAAYRVDCPRCGSFNVQIIGGDELELVGITLEDDSDGNPGPT